jgi:hypothetical protein
MTLPPDYDWNRIPEGFDLAACIRRDVDAVLRCDALVFLPGDWSASIGCKSEFAVARWAGKPVYQLRRDLATMYEIDFDYDVVIRAAPRRRPAEWERLTGIRIMDPDGWRSPQEKDWSEPIDEDEWKVRMMRSTVIPRMPAGEARSVLEAPKHWHGADVRRRAEQTMNENTDKCDYVIPGMLHLNRDPEESTDHRVLTEEAEVLVKRLAAVCHLAKLPMFVAVRISGGEVAHELPPGQFMRGGPWERWLVQAEPGDADEHLIILGLENQFVNGGG